MNRAKAKPNSWIVKRQADAAEFFGVSLATVQLWAKQGMPGKQGRYDVRAIVQWLRSAGPWRQHAKADSDDPMLADGDSPQLERYRAAKAALAELELEERKGSLLSRDKARVIHSRWAMIINRLGESLGKTFGPKATEAVNGALEKCSRIISDEFSGRDTTDDGTAE